MAESMQKRSGASSLWRRFLRSKKLGVVGAVVLLLLVLLALFGNLLAPFCENDVDPIEMLQWPSWEHPFGTDQLGRDVFSRIIIGARLSVVIAVSAAGLAVFISMLIGLVSGYFGKRVDQVIQRFVDAWMCFPDLIVLIVGVSVLGPGMPQTIGILALLYGIGGSRIVRGSVLGAKEQLYVQAAQTFGASHWRVIFKHILPTIMAPLIVLFTSRLGAVILAESSLSFLGLGVPPPAPTWGAMLSGSRSFMLDNPWLVVIPGLAITLVVFSVNIFGDALRDLLDPRQRGDAGRLK